MGDISAHFNRAEFACKCGCGFNTVDVELVEKLELVRNHFDKPVSINSGCRCPEHNQKEGGKPNSQHLYGRAADIVVKDVSPSRVADYIERLTNSGGVGRYSTFTHIDTRTGFARWNG